MATLSSPGIGSGLDVNSIVTQLVALERKPIDLLKTQSSALQTKLSSFGLLTSYLSNLQDIAAVLAAPASWNKYTATTSDATAVGVSVGATAAAGSYSIAVTQLARAQTLASRAYTASTAAAGTGTLRLEIGTWGATTPPFTAKTGTSMVDIVVAPGADSLANIQAQINAANAGVTASIVNDAGGARLVLRSSNSGEENAIRMTVTGNAPAPGAPNLGDLAYDPPNTTLTTQTLPPANATATINGLAIVSASNTLSNVVEGLTLTLAKVAPAVEVTVALDKASLKKAVTDFAKAYSDVAGYIAQQMQYNATTKKSGPLQGDRATLGLQGQLHSLFTGTTGGSTVFARLSDLGVELQKDGTLKVNDTRLTTALSNPGEVARAFSNVDAAVATNNGLARRVQQFAARLLGSDGLVSTRTQGLRDGVTHYGKQIASYEDRVAATEKRLLRQYGALDAELSKMKSLSNFVSQQVTMLTNNTKNN